MSLVLVCSQVMVQYNGSVMLVDRDGLDALVYVSRCAAGKGEAVMEMRRVLVVSQTPKPHRSSRAAIGSQTC